MERKLLEARSETRLREDAGHRESLRRRHLAAGPAKSAGPPPLHAAPEEGGGEEGAGERGAEEEKRGLEEAERAHAREASSM